MEYSGNTPKEHDLGTLLTERCQEVVRLEKENQALRAELLTVRRTYQRLLQSSLRRERKLRQELKDALKLAAV